MWKHAIPTEPGATSQFQSERTRETSMQTQQTYRLYPEAPICRNPDPRSCWIRILSELDEALQLERQQRTEVEKANVCLSHEVASMRQVLEGLRSAEPHPQNCRCWWCTGLASTKIERPKVDHPDGSQTSTATPSRSDSTTQSLDSRNTSQEMLPNMLRRGGAPDNMGGHPLQVNGSSTELPALNDHAPLRHNEPLESLSRACANCSTAGKTPSRSPPLPPRDGTTGPPRHFHNGERRDGCRRTPSRAPSQQRRGRSLSRSPSLQYSNPDSPKNWRKLEQNTVQQQVNPSCHERLGPNESAIGGSEQEVQPDDHKKEELLREVNSSLLKKYSREALVRARSREPVISVIGQNKNPILIEIGKDAV